MPGLHRRKVQRGLRSREPCLIDGVIFLSGSARRLPGTGGAYCDRCGRRQAAARDAGDDVGRSRNFCRSVRKCRGGASCPSQPSRSCGMLITDVKLDGKIDGVELAHFVRQFYPEVRVIATSGIAPERLPESATFIPKPWRCEDMLRQARRFLH